MRKSTVVRPGIEPELAEIRPNVILTEIRPNMSYVSK